MLARDNGGIIQSSSDAGHYGAWAARCKAKKQMFQDGKWGRIKQKKEKREAGRVKMNEINAVCEVMNSACRLSVQRMDVTVRELAPSPPSRSAECRSPSSSVPSDGPAHVPGGNEQSSVQVAATSVVPPLFLWNPSPV